SPALTRRNRRPDMPPQSFVRLGDARLDTSLLDNLKPESPSRGFVNDTLNVFLKRRLSRAFKQSGDPLLAGLVETMPVIDVAASRAQSVRALVEQQIKASLAGDTRLERRWQEAAVKLPETLTIGTLLGLDTPLKEHPLFRNSSSVYRSQSP